jgi:50S ribosomal protein L16 3-hydroxylase
MSIVNPMPPILGGLSAEIFLKDYWQKKPLLIRGARPDFQTPISAEELAGLACDPDVESRLILEQGGEKPWELRRGPFRERDFRKLADSHWTLLVQEANKHIPAVESMIEAFNFIPYWMFDDVMISYAADQGNVGPHFDHYDVFLFQASGKRHWQITHQECTEDNYLQGVDLRLMKTFKVEEQWTLEPGDMLYLPPKVAHHGVAQGPCMTFSFGFRSLRTRELMDNFAEFFNPIAGKNPLLNPIYRDTKDHLHKNPGRIAPQQAMVARDMLLAAMQDEELMTQWFCEYVTRVQGADMPELALEAETENLDDFIKGHIHLARHPSARLAWTSEGQRCEDRTGFYYFFVNGESLDFEEVSQPFIEYLCNHLSWDNQQLLDFVHQTPANKNLVGDLMERGVFIEG